MEIGDDFLFFIFYFRPEEPAAPVLTSPADSLRDSRYGPRRGRTQQAGAAPHGLGADAPQEDHYSGLAAPPSEMCRRKIGDDAAVIIVFFFDNKKLTPPMVPPHRKTPKPTFRGLFRRTVRASLDFRGLFRVAIATSLTSADLPTTGDAPP